MPQALERARLVTPDNADKSLCNPGKIMDLQQAGQA